LKRKIKISRDAVEAKHGWLCDCGNWTKVAPECHNIIGENKYVR